MNDAVYDAFLAEPLPAAGILTSLFPREGELVIFDIGACEGEDSLRYAQLFPRARVFTFEPLAQNQAIIRYHFARHRAERCELVPLALSDRAGTAEMHVSSGAPEKKNRGEDWNYGNKSSSLLAPAMVREEYPWLKFDKAETVTTDTLDHFCEERGIGRIHFVHLDVQGAEFLVLEGARRILPEIDALWLEVADKEVYAGQKLRREIARHLRQGGFRLVYEEMRGTEGDQFYVNIRRAAGRKKYAASFVERPARWVARLPRRIVGKMRRLAK